MKMESYRGTETRTSSVGDESEEFAQQDLPAAESMSIEWTDEKHHLYLKSMEASFLNQLYDSMDHLGWCPPKDITVPKLPQPVNCDASTPSGQFKVLRCGSWQKISFRGPESQLNPTKESCGFLTSPWIQHYRSARKPEGVASPVLQDTAASKSQEINLGVKKTTFSKTATCSKHAHPCNSFSCHRELVDGNTEMSDQNFIDDDIKGEKAISMCASKRVRVRTNNASSSDQVVPYSEPSLAEDVTEKCIPAAR